MSRIIILFAGLLFIQCKKESSFQKECIYIVGKGNQAKNQLIAKTYNLSHDELTHVGIGFVDNNELKIYEITPNKGSSTKIEEVNWTDFCSDSYTFIGVWEVKSDNSEIGRLKKYLKHNQSSGIKYDFRFDLATDNELYCSELVVKALNSLGSFNILPSVKHLPEKHKLLLATDSLKYYPVDFFINDTRFKKII